MHIDDEVFERFRIRMKEKHGEDMTFTDAKHRYRRLLDEDPGHTGHKFTFNLRYAGQTFDKESNLFHNGMRDYNPQTGKYIESGPIGLKGGINTYAYVGGNPVSNIDPDGENVVANVCFYILCLINGQNIPEPPPRPPPIICPTGKN